VFNIKLQDDRPIEMFNGQSIFINEDRKLIIEIRLNEDGSVTIPYKMMYSNPHMNIIWSTKPIKMQLHSQEEQLASMTPLPETVLGQEGEITFKLLR